MFVLAFLENVMSITAKTFPQNQIYGRISTDLLEESILFLKNTDVILGPSDDGGYYLIGMKKPNDYLFQNMTWSIDTVLSETIQRISRNSETYHLLKTLPDIDTADDWEKHGWF